MTRRKKGKRDRKPESVLESVFGVRLDANPSGGGDQPAPNPQPEVDPPHEGWEGTL